MAIKKTEKAATPKTTSFVKRSFGEEKKVILKLDENGLPITSDAEGKLIEGIPAALFNKFSTLEAKENKVALQEYKIAIQKRRRDDAEKKFAAEAEKCDLLNEELECIKTGKRSKKSIEAEEARLLAKLEKLRAQK